MEFDANICMPKKCETVEIFNQISHLNADVDKATNSSEFAICKTDFIALEENGASLDDSSNKLGDVILLDSDSEGDYKETNSTRFNCCKTEDTWCMKFKEKGASLPHTNSKFDDVILLDSDSEDIDKSANSAEFNNRQTEDKCTVKCEENGASLDDSNDKLGSIILPNSDNTAKRFKPDVKTDQDCRKCIPNYVNYNVPGYRLEDHIFSCVHCESIYVTQEKMKDHLGEVHSDYHYLCCTCGIFLKTKMLFRFHVKGYRFSCPHCLYGTQKYQAIEHHCMKMHNRTYGYTKV